jgi:hypothetical protein
MHGFENRRPVPRQTHRAGRMMLRCSGGINHFQKCESYSAKSSSSAYGLRCGQAELELDALPIPVISKIPLLPIVLRMTQCVFWRTVVGGGLSM